MQCEVCGKRSPEVYFKYLELAVCEDCAGEAWRSVDEAVIPSRPDVDPRLTALPVEPVKRGGIMFK